MSFFFISQFSAFQILIDVKAYLQKQPSLVDIKVPDDKKFTVCGDIHGQYYDLMNIFALNGLPSETNPYLFNGDFVDRGSFSVECIFTLFSFKLLFPNHFYMSRGMCFWSIISLHLENICPSLHPSQFHLSIHGLHLPVDVIRSG